MDTEQQALPIYQNLKMSYQLLTILCLHVTITNAAPLLLMPIPWMAQSAQQLVLQKQLMELQALQRMSAQSAVQMNNQPQPLMILLPKQEVPSNINTNEHLKIQKQNDYKNIIHTKLENVNEDLNSIVIEAQPETSDNQNQAIIPQPQRAVILLPNGRLSIGEIVSAIPWLPIEINVPDTIAWAYNGIASGIGSIITIIGSPFQGSPHNMENQEAGLKALFKQIETKKQNIVRPILMMPFD